MITLDALSEMNTWWKTGQVRRELAPAFKRALFPEIQEYLKLRQIIAIIGLRRTGKSTLLYQTIELLLGRGTPAENILYFSFDERAEGLKEVIDIYRENILRGDFPGREVYIFLDEIQKLEDWQNKVKVYYDLYPKLKFIVSGSASINILIDSKESLAGRVFYFHLDVLSFREFLELKGAALDKIGKNPDLWKHEIKAHLQDYLLKPFPEIVGATDELAKRYVRESIVEKAIFRDLSSLFGVKDIEVIERIVGILASNPGMTVNLKDLASDLGRSRQLVSNYLRYLEYCFVIRSLRNYRGSFKSSSRKLKRYYLAHPAIALSMSSPDTGKTIENLVLFASKGDFYWRGGNKEVDFIRVSEGSMTAIESKYSREVKLSEIKGLLLFMRKYKLAKGLVITEDCEDVRKIDGKEVVFTPLWKWLLE